MKPSNMKIYLAQSHNPVQQVFSNALVIYVHPIRRHRPEPAGILRLLSKINAVQCKRVPFKVHWCFFGCLVARSYLAGHSAIFHFHQVISKYLSKNYTIAGFLQLV